MYFSVKKVKEGSYAGFTAIELRNSAGEVLCRMHGYRDDIAVWLVGFRKSVKQSETQRARCQRLIEQLCHKPGEAIEENGPSLTLWKVMYAFFDFLDHPDSQALAPDEIRQAVQRTLHTAILNRYIEFQAIHASAENPLYSYRVMVGGQRLLIGKASPSMIIGVDGDSRTPDDNRCIGREIWTRALLERYEKDQSRGHSKESKSPLLQDDALEEITNIRTILSHFEWLHRSALLSARFAADEQTRKFVMGSFANLCKALVDFLTQTNDYRYIPLRRQMIPKLSAYVVQDEYDSLKEQHNYLELVLNSEELPAQKYARLERIVNDVRQDTEGQSDKRRLTSIIGAISAHYLRFYDFERALGVWKHLDNQDPYLKGLLHLYWHSERYATATAVFMGTVIALDAAPDGSLAHDISRVVGYAGVGLFMLLAVSTMLFILRRFLNGRGIDYIDLLLPRLLGAITVGLSVLVFDDMPWKIGLELERLNFILACLVTYVLSFLYIFIDVHRTLRLMPVLPGHQANQMTRSLQISRRVFLLGLSEAFVAVVFVSTLFSTVAVSGPLIDQYGIDLSIKGVCSLTFFPTLVVLWTGLSLFIGAFLQLLWQDKQITSPL